jgi:hypothetical protein
VLNRFAIAEEDDDVSSAVELTFFQACAAAARDVNVTVHVTDVAASAAAAQP